MSTPLVFGVAGGSGSGKTTVVRRIMDALGDTDVVVLEHDRYYRDHPELRLEERASLNYDHPNSLDTDLLVSHLRELRAGHAVDVPVYDFSLHARRAETTPIKPGSAINNTGSVTGIDGSKELLDYSMTKGGIHAFTSSLAGSMIKRGVRVN